MIDYQADSLFWQRFLHCAGFYKGELDGKFGPQSQAAAQAFEAASKKIAEEFGPSPERSEKCIRSLQPDAQRQARQLLKALGKEIATNGISFQVISGTRTYAEQEVLYAQGRSNHHGPIVTKARGGQSNHNFGLAWDIGLFQAEHYIPESPLYAQAGAIGKRQGLEWGGDWASIQDEPHFQISRSQNLATTRSQFEAGSPFESFKPSSIA